MKYITQVFIANFPFEVFTASENEAPLKNADGKEIIGSTLYTKGQIVLLERLEPVRLKKLIVHEVTHAYMYCTQPILFSNDETKFDDEFIAEFVGLYGQQIMDTANAIFDEVIGEKPQ